MYILFVFRPEGQGDCPPVACRSRGWQHSEQWLGPVMTTRRRLSPSSRGTRMWGVVAAGAC
jgi:hypothetical protein